MTPFRTSLESGKVVSIAKATKTAKSEKTNRELTRLFKAQSIPAEESTPAPTTAEDIERLRAFLLKLPGASVRGLGYQDGIP